MYCNCEKEYTRKGIYYLDQRYRILRYLFLLKSREIQIKILKDNFEKWKIEAKEKVKQYKKVELDEKEVVKWILEMK